MYMKSLLTIMLFTCSSLNYAQEQHSDAPRWLHQGLALYLADYYSDVEVTEFKNRVETLPTLEQLESINEKSDQDSMEMDQLMASYLLVKFIDTQWNREKLLALVDDYANFENILRFLKKDVEKHWLYHTLFKTYAFRSGDQSLLPLTKSLLATFKKALSVPQKNNRLLEEKQIVAAFDEYRTKMIESDNHLLIVIQTNTAVAGWALFSMESESRVELEALCVNPDYCKQDIHKKLVAAVHQNFRTIRSIVTANNKMNLKTPHFCGIVDFEKIEN